MQTYTLIVIVIFTFFIWVTTAIHALAIYGAYRAFANVTDKLGEAMSEIHTNSSGREWIEALRVASEQAVSVTELTKQKMTEFEPQFANFQTRYEFMLAQIDARVERVTTGISEKVTDVRDAVIEPAERFAATAAGIQSMLSFVAPQSNNGDHDI